VIGKNKRFSYHLSPITYHCFNLVTCHTIKLYSLMVVVTSFPP
jgi:hypothetical protein